MLNQVHNLLSYLSFHNAKTFVGIFLKKSSHEKGQINKRKMLSVVSYVAAVYLFLNIKKRTDVQ